jgi:hypothetical protein
MLSATGKCHTCGNESWVDECAECWKARQYEQRTFLDLKGALERLSRAQTHLPAHWRSDAQQAINIVQEIGSAVCPGAWSKHDQPDARQTQARPRPRQRRRHQPAIDRRNEPMTTTPLTMAECEEAVAGRRIP